MNNRISGVFAWEDETSTDGGYGKGKISGALIRMPPNHTFAFSPSTQTKKLKSAGSKLPDAFVYGAVSGSWEMSYTFSYGYLEPLLMMFEDYTKPTTSATTTHVFKKKNGVYVPPFVFKGKKLNRIAMGDKDETYLCKGCVAKSFKFSVGSSTSELNVSMSGVYADESVDYANLSATDFSKYESADGLTEHMCVFLDSIAPENYVGNVDSVSFSIDCGSFTVPNICTPIATAYGEGDTNISFSMNVYSNTPRLRERLYTGGKAPTTAYSVKQFMGKNRAPVDIYLVSYNTSMRDTSSYTDIKKAIDGATKKLQIKLSGCTIKSIPRTNGSGSKMMDSISSSECTDIEITVVGGPAKDIKTTPNHSFSAS